MPGYKALGKWHEITLLPLGVPAMAAVAAPLVSMAVPSSGRMASFEVARASAASLARTATVSPVAAGAALAATAAADLVLPTGTGRRPAHIAALSYRLAIDRAIGASSVLRSRIQDPAALAMIQGRMQAGPGPQRAGRVAISTAEIQTLVSQTVIAEGLRQADLAAARNFGASLIEEGLDGKVLLKVDTIEQVFTLVDLLIKREVGSASPNFVRLASHLPPSPQSAAWSHRKIGLAKAWEITRGRPEVSIAVLDDGVDTAHPALGGAVVAQRDFIGSNGNSAMPDGNDAHGTACAGIALSRDATYAGIAPGCSLIAARIAMADGAGRWVFDDFTTADAIDWCWRQGAAVLSNSWRSGAPSDAVSRALARARTQGRDGLGSVVAIAAGNYQQEIDFPASLPGYVTVGASNPADERKTWNSSDGEDWGSNYGPSMHLLAPGVFIHTTDISGPAGYDPGDFTQTFNGTSSATPAVAGTAALMISANPALSASRVRDLLGRTAKKFKGQTGWTPELGWGRLDAGKAVAAAKATLKSSAKTPRPGKKAKKPKKAKKRGKKAGKPAGKK
jgi:hypothetical protein